MEEDREVADLVRNLVRQYGDGSTDRDGDRSEHSGADDRAVHEVVRRVADQHERAARSMHFTFVRVAVPPQRELLEDEERQDADEERREDPARAQSGQRLRQQLNQRDAEQRADRVAHQPRYQPAAHPDGKNEEARRDRQSAEAAEQAEAERDGEQGHAPFYFSSRRNRGARARGSCGSALRHGSRASARLSFRLPDIRGSTACSTRRRCSPSTG